MTAEKQLEMTGAVLFILLVVPFMWWDGFVLAKLWGWFVVPLGAPVLGVWQAVGLAIVWNHVRTRSSDVKHEETITSWTRIGYAVLAPALSLLIGYLIKTWALA